MSRMSSSFSSLSFDTTTKATATDAAPANDAEAPSKDSSKEDAADATAVADGLVNSLAAAANGGEEGGSQGKAVAGFRWCGSNHTTNNADTGQCEAEEQQAKGEQAGVLFFFRQKRGVRLRAALFLFLLFINIT